MLVVALLVIHLHTNHVSGLQYVDLNAALKTLP